MLLVGPRYAKVVAVMSLALVLPDASLRSTLLLAKLLDVIVVAGRDRVFFVVP